MSGHCHRAETFDWMTPHGVRSTPGARLQENGDTLAAVSQVSLSSAPATGPSSKRTRSLPPPQPDPRPESFFALDLSSLREDGSRPALEEPVVLDLTSFRGPRREPTCSPFTPPREAFHVHCAAPG
mmetsp:Transcript_25335/g.58718  ORF Transcript_25335/g.58718 Transcript_25335/m.58718 type:complete len:126 (+) Transcript_25335:32-409(+)